MKCDTDRKLNLFVERTSLDAGLIRDLVDRLDYLTLEEIQKITSVLLTIERELAN